MIQTLDDLVLYLHGWAVSDADTGSFFFGTQEEFLGWIKNTVKYPVVWMTPPDRTPVDMQSPFRSWEVTVRVMTGADRRDSPYTPLATTELLLDRLIRRLHQAVKVDAQGLMRLDFGDAGPQSFTTADNQQGWELSFTIGAKIDRLCLPTAETISRSWILTAVESATVFGFLFDYSDALISWDGAAAGLKNILHQAATQLNAMNIDGHTWIATPTGLVWRGPVAVDVPIPYSAPIPTTVFMPPGGHLLTQVWP